MTGPVRVLLHVGRHKTGSKGLQSFLNANREGLRAQGVLYPAPAAHWQDVAYRISHFELFDALRQPTDDATLDVLLDGYERQRREAQAHTMVLSSEDLFDLQTAHEPEHDPQALGRATSRLAAGFAARGWRATVVAYLRRPDSALDALYAQYVKGSPRAWLDFDAFVHTCRARLAALPLLRQWAQAFGAQALQVRAYGEAGSGFDTVADFLAGLPAQAPAGGWRPAAPHPEHTNVTPDLRYIELLRRIDRRSTPLAWLVSRREVLDLAFAQRHLRRPASYVSPSLRAELLENWQAEWDAIGNEFAADPPAADASPSAPAAPPRLAIADPLRILCQILAARLRPPPGRAR